MSSNDRPEITHIWRRAAAACLYAEAPALSRRLPFEQIAVADEPPVEDPRDGICGHPGLMRQECNHHRRLNQLMGCAAPTVGRALQAALARRSRSGSNV